MNETRETSILRASKVQERKDDLLLRLPKGWTGREIMTTAFPPPRWSVIDLIPTGAILLSGIFKVGKSWLMLQLADCVSRGKPFLSRETNQGAVLYLALEDGPARIQRRAATMGIVLAENVNVFTTWPAGADGINSLDAWLEKNPVRLVIIDTLSRWQDDYHGNDIWARDTKRIADLKAVADLHDCTVLVVHHRSKQARDDIHQSVAGTNALQGAADGSLILDKKRNENTAKLSIVGRDIPEVELALEFSPNSCTWAALDIDPSILALNAERRAILDAIRELGGTARPGQLAERLGKKQPNISQLCRKLVEDGALVSHAYGVYALLNTTHSSDTSDSPKQIEGGTIPGISTMRDISGDSGDPLAVLDGLFSEGATA